MLLRSVKQLIEFEHVVGPEAWLFDEKDYCIIYVFVKTYKSFGKRVG